MASKDLSAQIAITADASGVEAGVGRAKKSLSDLGVTAAAAGKQAAGGLDAIGQGGDGAAKKVDSATKNMVGSIQRQIAALEAGSRTGSKFYEVLANQRGIPLDALKPYLSQLDQVATKQKLVSTGFTPKPLTTSLGATNFSKPLDGVGTSLGATAFGAITTEAAKASAAVAVFDSRFNSAGLTAKQTAAALRQVPAQLTDIIVGLQGGQAPLTVLLQQGGQLKDIFGGIRPAAAALGSAVIGLINPFTIAAAAAVALGLAYKQGSGEADEYARSIILSGNAAGTTVGELNAMAKAISGVVGTQGAAAEALALFAASGDVANVSLQKVAQAAIQLERVGGQAVAETAKQFSSLAKEPLSASVKLNETTRFLTLSLYQQIKALEDVGRTADAAALAQKGYADALESRAGQLEDRLGSIERAWRGIKDAAKGAWDAMLNVGRQNTLQEQLTAAQSQLATLSATQNLGPEFGGSSDATADAAKAALQDRIALLTQQIGAENGAASATAAAAAQVKSRIEFDKEGLKYLSDEVKMRKALTEARNQGIAAGASEIEIAKREADIRASFAKKGSTAKPPKLIDTGKSEIEADIAETKRLLDSQTSAFRNAESILEAVRSAGLVNESDYYEAKRAFIRSNDEAQANALTDQIARLEVENDLLTEKQRTLKDPNDRTRVDSQIIDNERKIADAIEKRSETTAKAVTDLEILNIRQQASQDALAKSFVESQKSAELFLRTFQLRQDRAVQAVGQGNQARSFNAGLGDIEDRFTERRAQLERERRTGLFKDNEAGYRNELDLLQRTKDAELDIYTRGFASLEAANQDFTNGAIRALENYLDSVRDIASQTDDLFSKAFKGLEDSLVEFSRTGKLNFKSLIGSITDDINRIVIRQGITGPLAEIIQGGFKSGEGAGGFLKDMLGPLLGGGASKTPVSTSVTQASAAAQITASQSASTSAVVGAISNSTNAIVSALGGVPSGERSIMSQFGDTTGENYGNEGKRAANDASALSSALTDTRTTAQAFNDALGPATSALNSLGPAGQAAAFALNYLPSLISSLAATSASGSGGGFASFFSSLFGGGYKGGATGMGDGFTTDAIAGYAAGGRPRVGRPSWVGEDGPEIFVPDVPGRVMSNSDSMAAMRQGDQVTNNWQIGVNSHGAMDRMAEDRAARNVARKAQTYLGRRGA